MNLPYLEPTLRRPLSRAEKLDEARKLIASAGIRDDRELFDLVNNIVSSIDAKYATPTMEMSKAQLVDSACWLEGPRDEPQPELIGFDKRGEYDRFTAGVRHRT